MLNNQSDVLTNIFQQTHLGKMSLITLIQNLPHQKLSNLPEIIYDKNGRYLKLNENNNINKTFLNKTIKQIEKDNKSINNIIQQRTHSVSPTLSIGKKSSKLSIEERYNLIANQFNLSSYNIEKQYELALKNRVEIPPVLMHRIIIDAIEILQIIMNELKQDQEKFQRILKRINELKTYKKLFAHHC